MSRLRVCPALASHGIFHVRRNVAALSMPIFYVDDVPGPETQVRAPVVDFTP